MKPDLNKPTLGEDLKLALTPWSSVCGNGPTPDEMVRRLLAVIERHLNARSIAEEAADALVTVDFDSPVIQNALRLFRQQVESDAENVLRELQEGSRTIDDPHFRHWAAVTIASYFSAQEACG